MTDGFGSRPPDPILISIELPAGAIVDAVQQAVTRWMDAHRSEIVVWSGYRPESSEPARGAAAPDVAAKPDAVAQPVMAEGISRQAPTPNLLSPEDLAARWGIPLTMIYRWLSSKKLPAQKARGRWWIETAVAERFAQVTLARLQAEDRIAAMAGSRARRPAPFDVQPQPEDKATPAALAVTLEAAAAELKIPLSLVRRYLLQGKLVQASMPDGATGISRDSLDGYRRRYRNLPPPRDADCGVREQDGVEVERISGTLPAAEEE